jgi:outer membrane lipoprotein LolB
LAHAEEKIFTMKKILLGFFCLALAACQPAVKPVKPVADNSNALRQLQRELALEKQNNWGFQGRIAISDGQQSGSLKMRWLQRGEQFDIEISLPITNQKYRLRSVNGKVRLEGFGLVMLEGDSAEAVLHKATGWRIPFQDMQLWLRGTRANRGTAIEFAPDGLPAQFRENGWLVDYRAWNSAVMPMPTKVFANSSSNGKTASVRLQIEAWE